MDLTYFWRFASVRLGVGVSVSSKMDSGIVSDVRRSLGEAARPKTHSWRRTARVPDRQARIMKSGNVLHSSENRSEYAMRTEVYTYTSNACRFLDICRLRSDGGWYKRIRDA